MEREREQTFLVANLFNVCFLMSESSSISESVFVKANSKENIICERAQSGKVQSIAGKAFLQIFADKDFLSLSLMSFLDCHTLPPKYPAIKSQYTSFITAFWSDKRSNKTFLAIDFFRFLISQCAVDSKKLNHRRFCYKTGDESDNLEIDRQCISFRLRCTVSQMFFQCFDLFLSSRTFLFSSLSLVVVAAQSTW